MAFGVGRAIKKEIRKLVMHLPYIRREFDRLKQRQDYDILQSFHSPLMCNQKTSISNTPCPIDIDLAQRITNFYQSCLLNNEKSAFSTDQWKTIDQCQRSDIHDLLMGDSIEATAAALADPRKTNLFYGMDNLCKAIFTEDAEDSNGKWAFSVVMRLSEAWGAKRLENFEVLPQTPESAEDYIKRIEDLFEVEIDFPNPYPGEKGVAIANRRIIHGPQEVISYRALQSLHQVLTMADIFRGKNNLNVVEIGAGVGRTAYYAKKFGFKGYTIIDLPLTCVAQAHYLATVLGSDSIQLSGEADKNDAIRILLPNSFLDDSLEKIDVVLNADSLTEMDYAVMRSYWNAIKKKSKMFISINHEYNKHTVRELIIGDPDVKTYSRKPYWLRNGYVEEIVTF